MDRKEYFVWLDELRESGETNMYGASAFLMNEFDLDRQEAKAILIEWMQTFSKRHPE